MTPYCSVSRRLLPEERQRVLVSSESWQPSVGLRGRDIIGAATTVDRVTLGGTVTGFGVIFDDGEYLIVAPGQIRTLPVQQHVPDVLPAGVVRLPVGEARR